jgi:MFS family permease
VPFCLGIKRSPESIGMQPDGMPMPSENRAIEPGERIASNKIDPEISARQAFRSAIFWNLVCAMTCRSVAFTTVTTHFIPMMVWKGLSQTEASLLLAGFAILNLPIHSLLGWIADFVNKPKLVTICLFLGVVAVIPMLFSNSLWALWFFAGLYTVLDASIPVYWAAVGDFFGRKSFGTIRGNMNLFYTWGSVLGPVLAGYVYDRTQSYALVFSGITISLLVSTALTSFLIKPWARLRSE